MHIGDKGTQEFGPPKFDKQYHGENLGPVYGRTIPPVIMCLKAVQVKSLGAQCRVTYNVFAKWVHVFLNIYKHCQLIINKCVIGGG